jgi:hypothetical protein
MAVFAFHFPAKEFRCKQILVRQKPDKTNEIKKNDLLRYEMNRVYRKSRNDKASDYKTGGRSTKKI